MPKKGTPTIRSKPLDKAPAPPKGMEGKHAIDFWKRITSELVAIGAITELHLEALEMLCRQWHIYRTSAEWIDANPEKWQVQMGVQIKTHPMMDLHNRSYDRLLAMSGKFGLTPEGLGKIRKNDKHIKPAELKVAGIADFAKTKTA